MRHEDLRPARTLGSLGLPVGSCVVAHVGGEREDRTQAVRVAQRQLQSDAAPHGEAPDHDAACGDALRLKALDNLIQAVHGGLHAGGVLGRTRREARAVVPDSHGKAASQPVGPQAAVWELRGRPAGGKALQEAPAVHGLEIAAQVLPRAAAAVQQHHRCWRLGLLDLRGGPVAGQRSAGERGQGQEEGERVPARRSSALPPAAASAPRRQRCRADACGRCVLVAAAVHADLAARQPE
mmetsp:Transcript_91836/g.274020  ORF Transcript_91836/g.274020 Transcript_91836/m.274020 type:complete len:238 (-) Transcript_91836:25-738(-)